MFLATTAIQDFWEPSEEILFLGEWCLLFDQRPVWEKLKHNVLAYPWDDPRRLEAAYRYCDGLYERMLEELTGDFNRIHETGETQRYWRIVFGEWLWRYIQILYDRYTLLKDALARDPQFKTCLLDERNNRYVQSNLEFVHYAKSDSYNLQLFSQILRLLGGRFPAKEWRGQDSSYFGRSRANAVYKQFFREHIRPPLERLTFRFSAQRQVLLHQVRIAPETPEQKSLWRQWRVGKLGLGVQTKTLRANDALRTVFRDKKKTDEFETICYQMMAYCLPLDILEGYRDIRNQVSGFLDNCPKAIISAIGWRFDTPAAVYMAEAVKRQTVLIGTQHGGGYGTFLYDAMLDNELKAVDHFISWGWNNRQPKVIPLPQPGLSVPVRTKDENQTKSQIFYVGNLGPRYQLLFQSCYLGPQALRYMEWQKKFLNSLTDATRRRLLVRLYYLDMGWSNQQRLEESVSGIKFDHCDVPFRNRLAESRLVVLDNNQTAYLEVMAMNIPTILFWDPDLWGIRKSAEPYFEQLRAAKILHDSPEAAGRFINDRLTQIESWWFARDVQEVVAEFTRQFARADRNWFKEWSRVLSGELSGSKKG